MSSVHVLRAGAATLQPCRGLAMRHVRGPQLPAQD